MIGDWIRRKYGVKYHNHHIPRLLQTTRKMTTHNRFYPTTQQRDAALRATFAKFRRQPSLIAAQVARFR